MSASQNRENAEDFGEDTFLALRQLGVNRGRCRMHPQRLVPVRVVRSQLVAERHRVPSSCEAGSIIPFCNSGPASGEVTNLMNALAASCSFETVMMAMANTTYS